MAVHAELISIMTKRAYRIGWDTCTIVFCEIADPSFCTIQVSLLTGTKVHHQIGPKIITLSVSVYVRISDDIGHVFNKMGFGIRLPAPSPACVRIAFRLERRHRIPTRGYSKSPRRNQATDKQKSKKVSGTK